MKNIYKIPKMIKNIVGEQQPKADVIYRPFFYTISYKVQDGMLIYHTLTKELVFLDNDECAAFTKQAYHGDETAKYLIEHYYLVSENNNDKEFMLNFNNTFFAIRNIYTAAKIDSLVIFTTSDCNARCFYCFEHGMRKVMMTEQTAHDVADFIEKKCEKSVRIRWFGGEPLYNDKVIDIISADLKDKGISFRSSMVTNGYLFDDDIVERAVSLWNLERVQITLDGTEKVYNRIKNYIYDDPNPFVRVLDNIERLLKAKIAVQIRLNMDTHNADDLKSLCEILVSRFNKYQDCFIYVKLLYENTNDAIQNREAQERHILIEKSVDLQKFIDDNMPKIKVNTLPENRRLNFCMSDDDKSAMIFSDGSLGKCEHYTSEDFYGSIYTDKIDYRNLLYHKEMTTVVPECDDCAFRNICMHPTCCEGHTETHCDDFDKMRIKIRFDSKMNNIYNKFKETEELNKV